MATKQQIERLHHVAFAVNAHLPAEYQASVFAEGLRMIDAVLTPRRIEERRVLIVGGAGYIGSVLTEHFLARGYRVRSLDLLLFNHGATVPQFLPHPAYEFMFGDLCDAKVMEAAFEGVTDVVLLAGLVGDPITKKYPEASKKINDDGILNVIGMLNGRGLNKVVFVSTCSNYGLIVGDNIADENYELKPLSLYAKSKVAVEAKLMGLRGKVDYHPTVLRFATAFGLSPRMRFDLTVSEFTRAMALDADLLVYDAHTWRPYCHLQDFGEVIRRVLEAPVERVAFDVFNAGGDVNNFTKQMIVDAILEQLPNARVRYQEHGSDPRNYRVNFARIKERLLFTPRYTVTDGVRELIAALRQNMFRDIETQRSFYGNYEISYTA